MITTLNPADLDDSHEPQPAAKPAPTLGHTESPAAGMIASESPAALALQLDEERRGAKSDRAWAMITVGALVLGGLLLIINFHSTLARHEAHAAAMSDQLNKQQAQLAQHEASLRQARGELSVAALQLDKAQQLIDTLERSKSPTTKKTIYTRTNGRLSSAN